MVIVFTLYCIAAVGFAFWAGGKIARRLGV